LQCVAVCRSVSQCVAVCRSVSQCVAVCRSVLQCVAIRCNVLQCVAMCCNVLQCVAMCCNSLQYAFDTHERRKSVTRVDHSHMSRTRTQSRMQVSLICKTDLHILTMRTAQRFKKRERRKHTVSNVCRPWRSKLTRKPSVNLLPYPPADVLDSLCCRLQNTRTHMRTHTQHTRACRCARARARTYTHTLTHTHSHTQKRTRTRTHTHTHKHTHTHSEKHTHAHTHTHTRW